MKNTKTYRQGDILISTVKSLPKGAEKYTHTGPIVLGEGETPGHRHELRETSKVEAYRLAEGLYLEVMEETDLVHPEHASVALLPGSYEIIHQHEYKRREIHRVQD